MASVDWKNAFSNPGLSVLSKDKKKGGSGVRRWNPLWGEMFRPPKEGAGEWIRILRGRYGFCGECNGVVSIKDGGTLYTCFNEKYDGEDHIGTCGHKGEVTDPNGILPCAVNMAAWVPGAGKRRNGMYVPSNNMNGKMDRPCVLHDESMARRVQIEEGHLDDNKKINIRTNYAYSIVRLGWFHDIEKTYGKKVFHNRVACEKGPMSSCGHCDNGRTRIKGMRAYYNLSWGFHRDLMEWDATLNEHCACGKGHLIPVGFTCTNCGEFLVDLTEKSATEDEVNMLSSGPTACNACGYVGLLNKEVRCVTEDEDGDFEHCCDNPEPLTIFDCNIRVRRSAGDNATALQITEWKYEALAEHYKQYEKRYDFDFLNNIKPEDQRFFMHLDDADQTPPVSAKKFINYGD